MRQYKWRNSSQTAIKYGVPQGSILGPLLFIIYMNDSPKIAQLILYPNDDNIIITGNDHIEVWEQLKKLNTIIVKLIIVN